MPEHCLVEISVKDWPKLRDLYKPRKYESNSYNLLQNYINWFQKDPSTSAKIYSLNGDWTDGTFLLNDNNTITFNTCSDCQNRLFDILNCLDENDSTYFYKDFPDRIRATLERHLSRIGLPCDPTTTVWYHLSPEDALKLNADPPEGITLSELSQEHVDTINTIWPHRFPGSEQFIRHLIENNDNIGALDKSKNLLAWCLILPSGALGLLHVKDDYKRKGLGSLVIRSLSKKLAEKGTDVTAPVMEINMPSRRLFSKLGFKEIDKVHWLRKPKLK